MGKVEGRGGYGFGAASFITSHSLTGTFLPYNRPQAVLASQEFVFLFAVALSFTADSPRIGS
jgi:hypothetical protein